MEQSWKKSTVYQIYPKSFNDSNNDGIGDLRGVIDKLDYIKDLGVEYIWLTPFYKSPQKDNGYDVEDYYEIDKSYGTMNDFDELVNQCNKRDIKIMLDMVFNHTSTNHIWFKKALSGDEKYKDFYIFKDSKDGNEPTNWESKFGGSAWKFVECLNKYYLHLFDVTQADLNWENEDVRKEIYNVVDFWIEKGVKGFRLDVINLISKPYVYEDDIKGDGRRFYTDGPKIHEYLKELNNNTFGKYKDIITVGEMSSTSIENCIKYSDPKEKELSMAFNFHHLKIDYKDGQKWDLKEPDFIELKKILNEWQSKMQDENGWNAVFWCNHDQPRIVSRFGNDVEYHKESAKMLATLIHCLRGTPYIYQGEEIGMTNTKFDSIDKYRDVESINYFNILKNKGLNDDECYNIIRARSRDNARTPMQWNKELYSGFSKVEPWINVVDNYTDINVDSSFEDEDSIFNHYKKLVKLRKEYDVIAFGDYKALAEDNEYIYAYIRTYMGNKLLVVNNFYNKEVEVKLEVDNINGYKPILSNYENQGLKENMTLKPYESIVYYNNI